MVGKNGKLNDTIEVSALWSTSGGFSMDMEGPDWGPMYLALSYFLE